MNIFSLCAGKSTRWNVDGIKQLIDIKGEPLLNRTIRKFKEQGEQVIIVTDNVKLTGIGKFIVPVKKKFTCETFLSTKEYWEDKVVILLGDVLYSDALIKQILKCKDEFRVFSDWEEIYAIVFNNKVFDNVISKLEELLSIPKNTKKLWDFVKVYLGGKRKDYTHKQFTYINDYTQDFDDNRDLNKYQENLIKYDYE